MLTFLHAADIHLDSPLRGISRYEGMPVEDIRLATRRAFDNLVELAIENGVRFVLLAGDLYDGDWKDTSTGMFLASRLGRLREAGIPVYLIAGNHDAANRMTKSLRLPENAHIFATKHAETMLLPEEDVAIHGQGFATQHVSSNLAAHYPPKKPGCFNIGLLHTSVSGYEGHGTYAPCTLEDLRLKEYDYWALGHVHTRQELSQHPRVIFPGNIQGRTIRETGSKGCTLVTVGDSHEIRECVHAPLDVIRWERAGIDLTGAETIDGLQERASEAIQHLVEGANSRPLVVRFELSGATTLHGRLVAGNQWRDDLRALAADIGTESVWMEKAVLRTSAPVQPVLPSGPLAELHEFVQTHAAGLGESGGITNAVQPLLDKLPAELKQEVTAWLDPAGERYPQLLAEAESLLMERLRGEGGSQ